MPFGFRYVLHVVFFFSIVRQLTPHPASGEGKCINDDDGGDGLPLFEVGEGRRKEGGSASW